MAPTRGELGLDWLFSTNMLLYLIKRLIYRRGTTPRAMFSTFVLFHRVRELERFQFKFTFKVIQGHWQCCHSIGHIRFPVSLPSQLCLYFEPFPRYYHLFPKMWRGCVTLNTSLLGVIYHACTRTPLCQSVHEIEVHSFTSYKDMIGCKIQERVAWLWPRPRPFYGGLSP